MIRSMASLQSAIGYYEAKSTAPWRTAKQNVDGDGALRRLHCCGLAGCARRCLLEHVSLGLNRWDSQGFVNERVWRHDSILRGQSMPRPYSNDLRARVIEAIEAGASRREVADRYELSPSVVVIWAQRWEETGSVAAKPSGGSTSPLEEHAEFLLRLIVEQPDSTLDEIVAAMRKKRIPGSRSAVWRFFERRNISFKKNFVRDGAKTRGNRPRAPALDAAARHV